MRFTRALLFLAMIGCSAKAPAVPTKAAATAGLTFCWSGDDDDLAVGSAEFRKAFGARLEGAGYKLVAKGRCDVKTHWNFSTQTRGGETSYTAVLLALRSNRDEPLEKIKLERERGEAPIDHPDLVALPLVNAINASPAMAAYASKRGSASAAP